MRKMVVLLIIAMFVLTACASKSAAPGNALQAKVAEKTAESAVQKTEQAAEDAAEKASQELVNLKCTIAGIQTIYWLKGNAKSESNGREIWLMGPDSYSVVEVGGKKYLLNASIEESGMSYEAMKTNYQLSKTVDTIDCWENVVTEDMFVLPDYPVITNEEWMQMAQDEMMKAYGVPQE